MEAKQAYHLNNLLELRKIITASIFLIFLLASPVVKLTYAIENTNYELLDTTEKEGSSKQESLSEMEKEKLFFHFYEVFSFQFKPVKTLLFYEVSSIFLNYHKDIHLPPPENFIYS